MKKIVLLMWSLSILLCADFSNNEGFSASEKRELEKIRKELQIRRTQRRRKKTGQNQKRIKS